MADRTDATRSPTREALIAADAAIARVRARLGESVEHDQHDGESAAGARTADEWERYALAIVFEAKLVESAKNFRLRWPALVKWRERVLKNRRRAKPADVAAALESLALECTLAGEFALAARAQHQAIQVMRGVSPIREGQPATEAMSA